MSEEKHSNPFKQFVEKNKLAPTYTLTSMDPFGEGVENVSPLENSYETGEYLATAGNVEEENGGESWVQYLDDETGCLYWYNMVTGEARWLTEEELQQQANYEEYQQAQFISDQNQTGDSTKEVSKNIENTVGQDFGDTENNLVTEILAGAWEKYYDDEGNPYYYNRVRPSFLSFFDSTKLP